MTEARDAQEADGPRGQDIDVFGLTDAGKVREHNNDHFLICSLNKHVRVHATSLPEPERLPHEGEPLAFLGLVADGVGGSEAGGEASRLATESLYDYAAHSLRCYYTTDPHQEIAFLSTLHDAVMRVHGRVLEEGESRGLPGTMATTLTLVLTSWPRAYVVQVGDSRCYRLRRPELTCITRDQTIAQSLFDAGALTRSEADRSHMKHVLTSAIGGGEGSAASPVTSVLDLAWDDVLLLCSDGLPLHVEDDEIREVLLAGGSAEAACRTLVGMALERGARDNVTVLVGKTRSGAMRE
jgi:serine/threonine protein phosphatase PrpC